MPREYSLSISARFQENRELHCIFLRKKAIIITSKHGTTIFFSHYNLFVGKLKEKLTRKAHVNTNECILYYFFPFILLHEKFLQFDWLRAVVFQLNLKYLHVKITNLLRVVV